MLSNPSEAMMKSLRLLVVALPAVLAVARLGEAAERWAPTNTSEATVVSLRLASAVGKAEVVVGIDGDVTVADFTLRSPERIVVDITGASLGLPTGASYDGVARGGITNVRYSQFRPNVVRLVLTLDESRRYQVVKEKGEVRVAVDGASAAFAAWQLGTPQERLARVTTDVAAAEVPAPVKAVVEPPVTEMVAPPVVRIPEAPAPAAVREFAQGQSQQPRIRISAVNEPIADVVDRFAVFAGRNIFLARGVSGTVNFTMNREEPWDIALRAMLNANGYDATEDINGNLIVDTFENIQKQKAIEPLITRTVRLNYTSAAAMREALETRLSRDCSQVAAPASVQQQQQVLPGTTQQTPAVPGGSNVTPPPQAPPTVVMPSPQQTAAPVFSLNCPRRGAVTVDPITNSVSITDIGSSLRELEAYARELDIRQPQVNIRAEIITVDRTALEGLGIRYDLGTARQFFSNIAPRFDSLGTPLESQIALGGNTISAIANASQRVPGAAVELVYSTALGGFDFTAFLEALKTNTLLDVVARPSANAMNNSQATLIAGTEVPVRVIDAGGATAGGQFARATTSFRQTGIILQVTPQVTNNCQVQMQVHVENSDVQFVASDVGAIFPKQQVDNVVLVASGETAVIAGLNQSRINVTRTGIPFLVDLPIIGRLFGVTQREETKRDLLILITPRVIDEGQHPGQMRCGTERGSGTESR
jgi:type IV pilus assembly protein PilQ